MRDALVYPFAITFLLLTFHCEAHAANKKISPEKPVAVPQQGAAVLKSNRVIATVDNEPITLRDLEEYAHNNGIAALPEQQSEEFKKLYEEYLTQLLVEKEAKSLNLNVSDDDINSYISEVKNQNHVDDAQLAELLKGKGMTMEGYRKQIRDEILRTKLTQQHARSTVNVSEEDIRKQLGLSPKKEHTTAEHLWQVFVPLEEDGKGSEFKLAQSPVSSDSEPARDQRREVIVAIQKRASDVKALKTAGSTYFSDLGVVDPQDLLPELRDVVSDLSDGELSEIVETDKGFYLFGLTNVEVNEEDIGDDVREKTRRQLMDGKLRTEMEQYITVELPKKYNLERKL